MIMIPTIITLAIKEEVKEINKAMKTKKMRKTKKMK